MGAAYGVIPYRYSWPGSAPKNSPSHGPMPANCGSGRARTRGMRGIESMRGCMVVLVLVVVSRGAVRL